VLARDILDDAVVLHELELRELRERPLGERPMRRTERPVPSVGRLCAAGFGANVRGETGDAQSGCESLDTLREGAAGDRVRQCIDLAVDTPPQEREKSLAAVLGGQESEGLIGETVVGLREEALCAIGEVEARGRSPTGSTLRDLVHESISDEHTEVSAHSDLGDTELQREGGRGLRTASVQVFDDRCTALTEEADERRGLRDRLGHQRLPSVGASGSQDDGFVGSGGREHFHNGSVSEV
jgi:hypothetical protein